MGLTESEIKEMVPPIGLAKKSMKLVPKVSLYFYSTTSRCRFLAFTMLKLNFISHLYTNNAYSFIHGVHAG